MNDIIIPRQRVAIEPTDLTFSMKKRFDADKFIDGYVRFLDLGSKSIGVITLLLMVIVIWAQVAK